MFLLPTALKREKATVQQRGQPRNHGTKPTILHALPYNRRLVSGLACSLNSPGRNSSRLLPTCTGPLGFAWIFTAISTSCFKMCCLAFGFKLCSQGHASQLQRGGEFFIQKKAEGGPDKVREGKLCKGQNSRRTKDLLKTEGQPLGREGM